MKNLREPHISRAKSPVDENVVSGIMEEEGSKTY
jgi:hypothetical protein